MAERPVAVGLAGDDEAHRILIQRLADHVVAPAGELEACRRWGTFLKTGTRPARARAPSGRPVYRNQRREGAPRGYAQVFVEVVEQLATESDVAIVLVDEDGDETRVQAAATAADILAERLPAVFGICTPCAEGWLVALIGPSRPTRLRELESALKKKVTSHPEQLTSSPTTAPHNAKRALHFLLDDEHDDVMRYPATTPRLVHTEPALAAAALDPHRLRRLESCGLTAFYLALEFVYAPMFRR